MLDLIWYYSWGQGYASASIRRQQFGDEKSICFYSQKAARRSLAEKGLISYQSGTVSDPEFPQGRAAIYTPTTNLVAVAERLGSVQLLHKNCTEHKCKITGGTRGGFCPTRGGNQLGVENTPSEKQPLLKLLSSTHATPACSEDQAPDGDGLRSHPTAEHEPPTQVPLVHADTHAAVGCGGKQSPSGATGRLAKRGEIAAAPHVEKPERAPKPETPEEAAFIDLYVKGMELRFKNGAPEGWHDRRKSLRAIRAFRRPGKTSVSFAVLTKCLKNAFDSDSVFPFKDNVFTLGDFLNTNQQHWMKFVNNPLRKKPERKSIEQVLKEDGCGNLKDQLNDPAHGPELLKDLAARKRMFEAFTKYTGYDLSLPTVTEISDMDGGFLLDLCTVWKEEKEKAEEMELEFPKPSLLMTRVIDFCLKPYVRNYVPSSFIEHRNRLVQKENA